MTRVSVVINAFNYGAFLGNAIDSVVAQRVPDVDVEIIVVDDGSTDNTSDVAAAYGTEISYYRKQNEGQATAIRHGVELASGDIICLLDADDEFFPTKIERVVDSFNANPAIGAVYNSYSRVNLAGQPIDPPARWNRAGKNVRQYGLFWQANGVPTSCISMRRDIAKRLDIPAELKICADYYILAALPHLTDIHWIPLALTGYRMHGGNAFAGNRNIVLHRNWRVVHSALLVNHNVELFKGLFETQECRDARLRVRSLQTAMNGFAYICRADASIPLKMKESVKLAATLLGMYHPLPPPQLTA